jgi:hypothetical protein
MPMKIRPIRRMGEAPVVAPYARSDDFAGCACLVAVALVAVAILMAAAWFYSRLR